MFWSIMTSIKKMGVRDVMCNLIMIISYQSIVACIHVVIEGQLQCTILKSIQDLKLEGVTKKSRLDVLILVFTSIICLNRYI